MSVAQIAELRKRIIASIGECKAALLKADNDVDEAFNNLKHQKLSRIVSVTGYDIEQAFEMYQKVNGDEEKTISRLLFLKDSGEWEKKSRPNIKDFIKEIQKCSSTYELFEVCPKGHEPYQLRVMNILFDFYTYFSPGELDNLVGSGDEAYFSEIKKALSSIKYDYMVKIFEEYLKLYREENWQKLNDIDKLFWNSEAEFFNRLRQFVIDNIELFFDYRYFR